MNRLKDTLLLKIRQRFKETWLKRIEIITEWLITMEINESLDDLTDLLNRPKKRRMINDSNFQKSDECITDNIIINIKVGQMRIKQLCFQLLRECDEIRVFVNLLFPNVMENTALKALEDILLELSQAQTTCINIRTSILRYTLSRMKVMRKGMIDSDELQWALQEIDEEALFFIFQYFLQLRNIYIVLYTLLDKNQIILGI